jgi:hypothetical protein
MLIDYDEYEKFSEECDILEEQVRERNNECIGPYGVTIKKEDECRSLGESWSDY